MNTKETCYPEGSITSCNLEVFGSDFRNSVFGFRLADFRDVGLMREPKSLGAKRSQWRRRWLEMKPTYPHPAHIIRA